MKALAIGFAVLLAGCAATPPPGIEVKTITVDHVTTVPCVDKTKVQPEPAHIGVLKPDARQAADQLGAVDKELRSWGAGLMALISGCTD